MRAELQTRIARDFRQELQGAMSFLRVEDPLLPSQWANQKRFLGRGESFAATSEAVRYSTELTPWHIEPMDSAVDPEVQTTVLMWASDMGKTAVASNLIGFCMDAEPSKVAVYYPKDDSAERFSKDVLSKMIEATPCLRSLIANPRDKSGANTIGHKVYPGGSVSIFGTGSPSNMRQGRYRMIFADEIDAMEINREGDPIPQIGTRTRGYDNAIQLLSSTPTIKGRSRIESWYEKSDKREWMVPCVKCGDRQFLRFAQINWKDHGGDPKDAHYHCKWCDFAHTAKQLVSQVLKGVWVATAVFKGIRGYFLNAIASTFPAKKGYASKLHEIAQDFLDAKHSATPKESLQVFSNTVLAETFQAEEDKKADWQVLSRRRENYPEGKIPQGVTLLYAGTDIQSDRIECEVVGFGRHERTWGIEHIVLHGDPRDEPSKPGSVWQRLEAALTRQWEREDGAILRVSGVGIDTGYPACIRQAYAFIQPRQVRNWRAVKGSSIIDHPLVARSKASKVDQVSLLMVGVNRIKALIYDRALLIDPAPGEESPTGFMRFPATYDDEWFAQLLAEDSVPEFKAGVQYRKFYIPQGEGRSKRNEALDMRVYAMAMYFARGLTNWDAEEKLLEKAKAPAPVSRPRPKRAGWMGGLGR